METVAKALLAGVVTLVPQIANAAIYQCKVNGQTEYRDTPCHYQQNGKNGVGDEISVKATKKSGSSYNVVGQWCQYATSVERNSARSVSDPKDWIFNNKSMIYKSPLAKQGKAVKYTLSSDFIQIKDSNVGSWFIDEYQSNSMVLTSSGNGFRYLKRGQCIVK